jgi:hypothetical protein
MQPFLRLYTTVYSEPLRTHNQVTMSVVIDPEGSTPMVPSPVIIYDREPVPSISQSYSLPSQYYHLTSFLVSQMYAFKWHPDQNSYFLSSLLVPLVVIPFISVP